MEDNTNSEPQGELFNELWAENVNPLNQQTDADKKKKKWWLNFETFLFVLLMLIIGLSIAYAFGVCHGRQSTGETPRHETRPASSIPAARTIIPVVQEAETQPEVLVIAAVQELPSQIAPETSPVTGSDAQIVSPLHEWTIQVVTYTSEAMAQDTMGTLRVQGYEPFVIPSGQYYQVCISTFPTKEAAQALLAQFLKGKSFRDAYVRKIKR